MRNRTYGVVRGGWGDPTPLLDCAQQGALLRGVSPLLTR